MIVLGIWDGHDSGAALVIGGRIVAAANEERFTRRKLEIRFPKHSINFCLNYSNLKPTDIEHIAAASSDFSLTLTRLYPKIKENYYYIRRKLKKPNIFAPFNRPLLNNLGRLKPNSFFSGLSKQSIKKNLIMQGFKDNIKIHIVEHHLAHAASAFYCSGFKKAVCITIDALGDGISATVNICENNRIKRVSEVKTKDSLGLLYQEATQLLGIRILEDEGKVMCLSDYSKGNIKNPLDKIYSINNLNIKLNVSMEKRWHILKKLLKKYNKVDFAHIIQKTLEKNLETLFSNAISRYNISNVCWSGGVASNIKANMKISQLQKLKKWFVFPHMGDGGLAAGAALYISSNTFDTKPYKLNNVFLGPEYSNEEIKNNLNKYKNKLYFEKISNKSKYCAELIYNNKIVYWFDNRMEFGPRALGARSILTRPDILDNKRKLNKLIKKREQYQPFCPSILHSDAKHYLINYNEPSRFMTMGYNVNKKYFSYLSAVMGEDNSSRPQTIDETNKDYFLILKHFKKLSNIGAILNTSFNIHGEPIVCTPDDAIKTLIKTKNVPLMIGNWLVRKK